MQQVKLCSESVENSAFLEFGASSSDIADVLLDSSSTTGAAKIEKKFNSEAQKIMIFFESKTDRFKQIGI